MTRRESNRRIRMLGAIVMVGVGLMAVRALWVGGVRADALSAQARNQQERLFEVPAERGIIEDRNGLQLASDRPTATITATPYLVTDPQATAAELAALLKIPAADIQAKLSERGGYAKIATSVDQDVADKVRDAELVGIDVEDTWTRYLPQRRVAAQVMGLVGEDGGQSGLEAQFDRELTGTPGVREESRDPLGHTLKTLHAKDPQRGTTVRLTIDTALQDRVERVLAETRKQFGAKSASAVIMRPKDGAILAMASVPRYDPNDRTRFNVPENITLYDRTLRDSHNEGATNWSTADILERSSNKGTVLIAQRLGAEPGKPYVPGTPDSDRRLSEWITKFGFGARTGLDYPGEEAGRIPDIDKYPEEWSGTSILNIPIGQGVLVTETQMARAYAAIANGGRLVTPHLVAKIGDRKIEHPPGERIISWKTSRQVDSMLRRAVSDQGTGAAAQVPGYDVAGKTGTANKIDPKTGKYSQTQYVASFVGYLPADKPQLLIAVTVDEPKASIFGGDVAAPAFERIAQFSLLRLEIPPA